MHNIFLKKLFKADHVRTLQIRKQILYSAAIKFVSVIVTLAMVPLLIDVLDQERYGVWLTLSTIFYWFSNFDIGLGNGLRNKLTEAITLGDIKLARSLVSTSYALVSIIFIVVLLIFFFCNTFLNWNKILNTETIAGHELFLLTTITSVFFILRFIFQLVGVVYLAIQAPAMNSLLIAAGNFFSFLLLILVYKIFDINDLIIIGAVLTGVPVVVLIFSNLYAFRRSLKLYAPSIKYIQFNYSKDLFVLGGNFFIMQIAAVVFFSTANILITQLFNPTDVVVYNSVFQYYNIPIMIYAMILAPMWSAVTDAYVQRDYLWMKKTLRQFNYISFLLVIGIIIMTLISPFIYKVWLKGQVDIPINLSIAMAVYAIINVIVAPYSNYINGIGKLRLNVLVVLFTLIVYIPFAVFLGRVFHSSLGIVIALCCVSIIGLYFQLKQVNKLLKEEAFGIWNK